jgi:hypothetical protein
VGGSEQTSATFLATYEEGEVKWHLKVVIHHPCQGSSDVHHYPP